ncbi:MAG: hypothetical protein QM765_51750 [Myxococcales bacterium]
MSGKLERLREAGHPMEQVRGRWYYSPTLDSYRNTQLFHTLPHEVGHHVDHRERERIEDAKPDFDPEHFRRRPSVEREQFAHRYADSLRGRWKELGLLPLPRRQSRRRLEEMGLAAADFGLEELD